MSKEKVVIEVIGIEELLHDPLSVRRHTPKNIGAISESLQMVGAARSVVIDEDKILRAGNGTVDAAIDAGIRKVKIIDAEGDELIAVRRTNLSSAQKVLLGLADNRAGDYGLYDTDMIQSLQEKGIIKIDDWFTPKEFRRAVKMNNEALGLIDSPPITESSTEVVEKKDVVMRVGFDQDQWDRIEHAVSVWRLSTGQGDMTDAESIAAIAERYTESPKKVEAE